MSDRAKIASMMSAAASTTCSQLSKISSRVLLSDADATLSAKLVFGCRVTPSTAATASGMAPGSPTEASSITHTPSGKSARADAATARASRVLPTPPTPVNVTSRCSRSAARTCAISWSRPMRPPGGTRRLPTARSAVRSAGKSSLKPVARTWNSWTGPVMSRSWRAPRGRNSMPGMRCAVDASSRICPPWPADITRAARLSTAPK